MHTIGAAFYKEIHIYESDDRKEEVAKATYGEFLLAHEPRSGRPSTVNNEDIKLAIEQDSSQTCHDLTLRFNIQSIGSEQTDFES
ncbi:hypothetical protein OESDEN_03533 [Oesophagostomum dentatum]|uniref:Uncharacterized protein n=1 Tax=Oesophagostomum dentatum TaxID=61180 RepID=A0A0B1TGX3_OESDE|nr:hypothetical protein OESDEN_03533 [Oesophagostomum dentatum]